MIVFTNKGYMTRSDMLNRDWTGNALYVVPDGSELAQKIIEHYPYYEFVVEDGELIDIIPTEHPPEVHEPTFEETVTEFMADYLGGAI